MATERQKQAAVKVLMRAIHAVEAAQHSASVRACNIDQSAINSAKDQIYSVVQKIERE